MALRSFARYLHAIMWWRNEPDPEEARALRAANGSDVHAETFNRVAQWVGLAVLFIFTTVMAVRTLVE